jgi:hypothetical protein
MAEESVPGDKIKLRLLLSNGQKADFVFVPTETIQQVKTFVFEHWPSGMVLTYEVWMSS